MGADAKRAASLLQQPPKCSALFSDRPLHDLDQAPGLGLGQGPALRDGDEVTRLALVGLVVSVNLSGAPHILAVHGVRHLALDQHRNGLVHLVAYYSEGYVAYRFFVL